MYRRIVRGSRVLSFWSRCSLESGVTVTVLRSKYLSEVVIGGSHAASHLCIRHHVTHGRDGRSGPVDRQQFELRGNPCHGHAPPSSVRLASERSGAPRARAQQSFREFAQGSSFSSSLRGCRFGGNSRAMLQRVLIGVQGRRACSVCQLSSPTQVSSTGIGRVGSLRH